jgi:hypothetical protein
VRRVSTDHKGLSAIEIRRSQIGAMRPNNVITAFLRVKLLGMNLLTIDARVVHAPTGDLGEAAPVAFPQGRALTPLPDQTTTSRDGQRADLAYAMRLLEEGSKNLDEARGMRALDELGANT